MKVLVSLVFVLLLVAIAWIGSEAGGEVVFGVVLPYAAFLVFLVGFTWKIVKWARAPVPFRIPTTSGQQKSLPWIRQARFDNPATGLQVVGRMALEVLLFRSLFQNTKAEMRTEKGRGPRLVFGGDKSLWIVSLIFHWTFLVILIRHLRFFLDPVPGWLLTLGNLDAFFQVSVPALYITDVLVVLALGILLLRRFTNSQVRAISLVSDYFPLLLLLGVVISGIVVRYFAKTDVVGVKELGANLLTLRLSVPAGIGAQAYVHLFLVCTLLAYFPFSKLMHAGGVFLSPTRNLANNNRMVRHINPWNRPVAYHRFEDWEKEFAKEIEDAGYELERD